MRSCPPQYPRSSTPIKTPSPSLFDFFFPLPPFLFSFLCVCASVCVSRMYVRACACVQEKGARWRRARLGLRSAERRVRVRGGCACTRDGRVCARACLQPYIYMNDCINKYTHTHTHTYIYINIYIYNYKYNYNYIYIHTYIYIYVYLYLHLYLYLYICVCLCVCVCTSG